MLYLTTSQAAKRAGVTPSTIRRWVDQGYVEAKRTSGGHRRVSRVDLDKFLRLGGNEPRRLTYTDEQKVRMKVKRRIWELRRQGHSVRAIWRKIRMGYAYPITYQRVHQIIQEKETKP